MLPARSFPPYSYVPGKYPHPIRDPAGHSYGQRPPIAALDAARWSECQAYLWGFDLFNHGYYWEAHETWEAVWHACERSGAAADLLKGLIKLAAAGVKAREGSRDGVRRHLTRAADLFGKVHQAIAPRLTLLGLTPGALARRCRQLAAESGALASSRDAPSAVVLPMEILPVLDSQAVGTGQNQGGRRG
jgi:hypothetical protein